MDIFISYRCSRDSSDRDLRQVLERAFADRHQYELAIPDRASYLPIVPMTDDYAPLHEVRDFRKVAGYRTNRLDAEL